MTQLPRRWVFFFGQGRAEAGSDLKDLVGGKGASLADMSRAQLNVPPGFTLSTECCEYYYRNQQRWPDGLDAEVRANLARLEKMTERRFGLGDNPLLVAVRSGAAQSMPGMMDTVLNVGLNPECVAAMGRRTGNPRGAWEAYLHYQRMYLRTVSELADADIREATATFLRESGKSLEDEWDALELEAMCGRLAELHRLRLGFPFPTDPWAMLCAAIDAVFRSWMSERAMTYRANHKIQGLRGTAVNVQAMCPSEVSGVLFTAHPVDPSRREILIESSYGLGEAVVLGKVTPDRFVLDKDTLALKERLLGRKETRIAALAADGKGQTGAADEMSLSVEQIGELARLGLRVESYFGHPCDIEWGLSQGEFFLLQARAIRYKPLVNHEDGVREQVRRQEIENAAARAFPGGTVWSRFNLSEILPEPLPLTWSVMRRFMSSRGGFGLMYQDLGYNPDPSLAEEGTYDLIAGRVYCNLSREPRMQFGSLPFEHPFEALKKDPSRAIYPQAIFNPRKASLKFWAFFPYYTLKMWWGESKRQAVLRTFAARFEEQTVPRFHEETARARSEDWTRLSPSELWARFETWNARTLTEFARESLKPTALAALLLAKFEAALARRFQPAGVKLEPGAPTGLERAQAAMRELTMGVHPPADADLTRALERMASGEMSREDFLAGFGHRGSQEMELAQPRWREDPRSLDRLVQPSASRQASTVSFFESWERIARELKLQSFQMLIVERELRLLHQLLGLREAGKHHMLKGYELMRRALVELDRRFELDGGLFYLKCEEIVPLVRGERRPPDMKSIIAERMRRREIALSLPMPQVLFSDDLEAIGRDVAAGGVDELRGTPLSAGVAEARAWVLDELGGAAAPREPYILVCPSTDPSWVPLFGQARGLVMETGGVLSHGAIVAREYGLPAVAGIPDVHRRLKTGQRLRIDGARGLVRVLDT
jgi:pyruvate,water dikinase